jgi:hypothetical protein
VYLQEALQVASQLGTVLGGNSEAFARVVSFVSQHSHQPTALCQFMSVTLSQLQQGQPAQQALDAAAAAAAAAVTAATATATAAAAAAARAATVQPASPSGKPQQQQYKVGLML